ncbi:NAD(P)/FAD-dependent oxidoreductase [Couchioplanes caeruleus]|uniref:NAD(P)/FAD-dependent oxidoreductase n=1 Tax=Couchioplanes caeruleus TaxID=56438 RepID=UPI0020BE59C3|nr:NAD(P)/FAD-dependent oxidoreductase [Couchioplanes caeruleus]UQU67804.1 NAD(P)/FAD-dependent oxidoreductase [Couchioplanes caeruleus]
MTAPPRIVIVGAGFAGYHAARRLSRRMRGAADITLINPTDYFLYLPLLPEVTGGVLEPRQVTVPLADTLPGVRVMLGEATSVDHRGRRVQVRDPDGRTRDVGYDRLLLTVGSVTKLLPIPGAAGNAHGFRGVPEALYLRDHLIRQVEMAASAEDPAERRSRCTFVVVGAGYTGTEVVAQGQLLTAQVAARHPGLRGVTPRWLLVEHGDRILGHLDRRLSGAAARVLRDRGVELRTKTSVTEATATGVHLDDGTFVPGRTLVWCVGVRPDPLIDSTGLRTDGGRLVVDACLGVPGHPEILACGDAAAVPDLTRPGQVTAMTAQHAQRQGVRAADNIAAAYGHGRRRPYRHSSLGFAVDLGGRHAAANPLGVPLSGLPALAVTRGYHLTALPANRIRTAAAWLLAAATGRPDTQLGLVPATAVPLDTADPEVVHAG